MSGCSLDALAVEISNARRDDVAREELQLASRQVGDQLRQTDLSVPDIHCGACIHKIEKALNALAGVEAARVNLSTKRVTICWRVDGPPPPLLETLEALGYSAHIFDVGAEEKDATLSELIRALAVAGFAAGNIMLFSISVWSGAEPPIRDQFHWLSALIALPALVYSGRVFFRSAWASLSHGQTNMDVPISIGVSLAFGMSLYDTVHHGEHAYFDASISLLFFLLIGRTLDHMMRERARVAVKGLARLAPRGAIIVREDGGCDYLPVSEIEPGMTIRLAAGERVPVDATVLDGRSDLDCSLVSGESAPLAVEKGSALQAGTLNLTGPLTIMATAAANASFLAEMVRLMEAAEGSRSGYRRIADRAARLYAPVVHLTALFSFIGWMIATNGDFHRAITIAVAVLIITCPCALGLAVPMVQVVAARRLFANGIMVKDGSAMERLAEIDTVIFDKTGTLTLGDLRLVEDSIRDPANLGLAAGIAVHSRHPHARALAAANAGCRRPATLDHVSEHAGLGLEAVLASSVYRLGCAEWALDEASRQRAAIADAGTVLTRNGQLIEAFHFEDRVRPGAREAIVALTRSGLTVRIISGDRSRSVELLASALGVGQFEAGVVPGEKASRIASLTASGHAVLMVGDGLNDAAALVAAHASMAPATAADVGRNAADFVFLHESLEAVPLAFAVSRDARRLIRQNFVLAVSYNVLAVPIAILGCVTPLIAALAMSLSSIIVVSNALRLRGGGRERPFLHKAAAMSEAQRPPLTMAAVE
jgi:Cu2+-exporting ATPase